ncbi:MAG TPA: asparagine synthase (glutamine-hydrolyzing) [Bacteroidia bacterium]|jgi:asparagine synthase (glutamine-hydrolysing)|nr:asparagine synthase (glutamine-hydrolyzing) [Bacteroidia bacterium]
MCGISGVISLQGLRVNPQALKRMNDAIRHRGPDGDGFLFFRDEVFSTAYGDDTPEHVRHSSAAFAPVTHIQSLQGVFRFGFAHRRLAIIDLGENGHQPLCNAEKNTWITYNGEIYNYIELKTELQSKGHKFLTRTDTEVILAAYKEWGSDCVLRFNGMWAFVLFDAEKNIFFGSRDRFGVKPFYYYTNPEYFIFASEQKALLKHPSVKSGINAKALADYFVAGEIEYQQQGLFENILELFPATSFTLELNGGAFKKWTYYSLKTTSRFERFDRERFNEYRDRCETLVKDAVRLRLRSDVPVGSCLSGGIDSSAIVGLIKALSSEGDHPGTQLETFTASFPEKEFDESHWAILAARQAGANSHLSVPSRGELMQDIESLIYSQDAPIWSTSTYAQFRVMRLAKETGIKVILDGQGGDELFAGYPPHYTWYLGDLVRSFSFGKALNAVREQGRFPGNMMGLTKDYLKLKAIHKLPVGLQMRIGSGYFRDLEYLDEGLLDQYKHTLSEKKDTAPRSLNDILLKEFVNTRLKGYLKCEDRSSMWNSVESRTPFADDHPLIEYVFSIPGNYKIHQGTHKYLMRQALQKYIPPPILQRKDKMGYASPNNKWVSDMREEMRPYFTDVLRPYFRMDKLMKDYDSFFDIGGKPENGRVFKFMVFAVWMKVFELK